MNLRMHAALPLSFTLGAALCLAACSDDGGVTGEDETAGSETATDTAGDEIGEEENGDGDGDQTGDGDGDGDGGCPVGSEGCPCTMGGGCDPGLVCDAGVCSPDGSGDGDGDSGDGDGDSGDGDGDSGDGDGDGDSGDGDGDGDPGNACAGDEFIEIEAEDADVIEGWDEAMSMLGEDVVLAWDNQDQEAFVTWNIDVPCDDTWHIWVRAINQGNNDSFFATVDGEPEPTAIFEVACDQGPNQASYEWRELNWREQGAPGCVYVEDPWVQDWTAGTHEFTLSYRESYSISKIWLTNTDQTPPD